jgi:hypothetical protein
VEHFGSHYGVILNDPELRAGLIADGERSQRSAAKLRASLRLRFQLAGVLRALAIRIEPQLASTRETSGSQPLFVES